jgi:hypothetical protein
MIFKKIIILSVVCVMALVFGFAPKNAESKIITNVPSDISGEELKAAVIEDFENAEVGEKGWIIQSTPKQFTKGESEDKFKSKNPVPVLELKVLKGGPNDMSVEEYSLTGQGKKKEKVLGTKFKFRYPGNNTVHIIAPPEISWKDKKVVLTYNPSTRKEEQERGLQLPGKARGISIWVHGRGNPYDFEVWVKDYRGDTHILKFGSVNFVGWRPLKVYIPTNVPQSFESFPQTRITKITRFVLRSQGNASAEELINDTYFFFDQIKGLSDTYEVTFDGADLEKEFTGETKSEGGATPQPK